MGQQEQVKQPHEDISEESARDSLEPAAVESKRNAAVRSENPSWWFCEAWLKLRPFVIEFVVEAVVFGLFLLSLEGFHQLADKTSLDADDRLLLHKFHFYSHFVVLGIFALSFIIQVLYRKYNELFEDENQ